MDHLSVSDRNDQEPNAFLIYLQRIQDLLCDNPFEKKVVFVNFALFKFVTTINDRCVDIPARQVKAVTVRKRRFNKWTCTAVCFIIHCLSSRLNN
jgi:hypothetical protein